MIDSKWQTQVKRGILELCIMNLVNEKEMYGYQIVKRLSDGPGLVVTLGTIYPLLSRLKRQGLLTSHLVESDLGPARRTYGLTPDGRIHLQSINTSWREIVSAVDEFISS